MISITASTSYNSSWHKRVQFFKRDLELIAQSRNKKGDPTKIIDSPLSNITVTCSAGNSVFLVVGDNQGNLNFIREDYSIEVSYQAYTENIVFSVLVPEKMELVTLGTDNDGIGYRLRIWDLNHWTQVDGGKKIPAYLEIIPLCEGGKLPVPTALAVTSNGSQIALGLEDGCAILLTGEGNIRKSKTIRIDVGSSITGLLYMPRQEAGELLFATTQNSTKSIKIETTKKNEFKETIVGLSEIGAEVSCIGIYKGELLVGDDQGVHFYSQQKTSTEYIPSSCKKTSICCFSEYVAVVEVTGPNNNNLTLYHLEEKFTAHKSSMATIVHITQAWDKLVVFTRAKDVYVLIEEPEKAKKEILYKRSLYQNAINMAKRKNKSEEEIAEIYFLYGSYFLNKGDYDNAMQQYLHTIGTSVVEPSFIIRSFLKNKQNHNLILYLERLHDLGLASKNHTTLLLNCYSKSKDFDKINKFISRPDLKSLDKDVAIQVCRDAKRYKEALALAMSLRDHKLYIKILLEDMNQPKEAIKFMHTLLCEEAACLFKDFGKDLLIMLPAPTLEFAKELCSDYHRQDTDTKLDVQRKTRSSEEANATYVDKLTVHVHQGRQLIRRDPGGTSDPFLKLKLQGNETIELDRVDKCLDPVFNTDITFSLANVATTDELSISCFDWNANGEHDFMGIIKLPIGECIKEHGRQKWYPVMRDDSIQPGFNPTGDFLLGFTHNPRNFIAERADPEDFIPTFSSHPDILCKFLEFVVLEKVERKKKSTIIYDTLLEIYLQEDPKDPPQKKQENRRKAEELLSKSPKDIPYDVNHALLVCHMYGFKKGTINLYKQKNLYLVVAQHYMEQNDNDNLIQWCKENSVRDPKLWTNALMYFADKPAEEVKGNIKEVIDNISLLSSEHSPSPIEVVEMLTGPNCGKHQLDTVKSFLIREMEKVKKKVIQEYTAVSETIKQIAEVKRVIHTYQTQAIEFPSAETESDTDSRIYTLQSPDSGNIDPNDLTIGSTIEYSKFLTELTNKKEDGFEIIAQYLQRRLFERHEKDALPTLDPTLFNDLGLTPI